MWPEKAKAVGCVSVFIRFFYYYDVKWNFKSSGSKHFHLGIFGGSMVIVAECGCRSQWIKSRSSSDGRRFIGHGMLDMQPWFSYIKINLFTSLRFDSISQKIENGYIIIMLRFD